MQRIQANFNLYAEDIQRAIAFYQENFGFEHLGNIGADENEKWAALKLENTIIWLGENGASLGLILLVDKNIESLIDRLKTNGVSFFIPDKFSKSAEKSDPSFIATDWGKHSWFYDSERNVVMLFEPAEG